MPTARAAALWIAVTAGLGLVLSFAVLGVGWLLSHAFPITVFQGAVVFAGTLAAGTLCASAARIAHALLEIQTALRDWLTVEAPGAEAVDGAPAAEPAVATPESADAPTEPPRSRRQVH